MTSTRRRGAALPELSFILAAIAATGFTFLIAFGLIVSGAIGGMTSVFNGGNPGGGGNPGETVIVGDPHPVAGGGTTVSCGGFSAGAVIQITLTASGGGSPVVLGTTTADGAGLVFEFPVVIPADAAAGAYTVACVGDKPGGAGFDEGGIIITPATAADFSASPDSGLAPLEVSFLDLSSGNPASWSWDFGDGSGAGAATAQNPVHAFASVGTYTVTLTASGPGGPSSVSHSVTVIPPTTAAFIASPPSGLAPLDAAFTDASIGSPTSWDWDFGDGTSHAATRDVASHTFSSPGAYTVTLTASGPGGTSSISSTVTAYAPLSADFSASPWSSDAGTTVSFTDLSTGSPSSWSWDFGDGGSASALQNPTHIFAAPGTYHVTLTATGPGGSSPRTRDVTAAWATGAGSFAAVLGSNGANPDHIIYRWNGDLIGASGAAGWYNEPTSGVLSVVTPGAALPPNGATLAQITATGYATVRVEARAGFATVTSGYQWLAMVVYKNDVPIGSSVRIRSAGLGYWADTQYVDVYGVQMAPGDTISVGGLGSVAGAYNYGCCNGTYLRVGSGDFYMNSGTVHWSSTGSSAAGSPPVVGFSASATSGSGTLTTTFTDTSTGGGGMVWDFGDGATSMAQAPTHTYSLPGDYTVSLTEIGSGGQATLTRADYIHVAAVTPAAAFSASGYRLGTGTLSTGFTDTSANYPASWLWDFGDGTTSTSQNPSHTYAAPGTYTVSLAASNSAGSNTLAKTGYVVVNGPHTGCDIFTEAHGVYTGGSGWTGNVWVWLPCAGSTSSFLANKGAYGPSLPAPSAVGYTVGNYDLVANVARAPGGTLYYRIDNYGTEANCNGGWTSVATSGDVDTRAGLAAGDQPYLYFCSGTAATSASWAPASMACSGWTHTAAEVWYLPPGFPQGGGSNPCGGASWTWTSVTPAPTPAPTARFTAGTVNPIAGASVAFTDGSLYAPTNWCWTFGDAAVLPACDSTSQNPTHAYASAGTYTVSLKALNINGSDTLARAGYIVVDPVPVLSTGLTARWHLDEVSGTSLSESVSGRTATLSGTTSFTAGQQGGAVRFGASGSAAASSLTSIGRNAATVSFWMRTTSTGYMYLYSDRGAGSGLVVGIGGDFSGGTAGRLYAGVNGSGIYHGSMSSTTVNDGSWHLVTVTMATTAGTAWTGSEFRIYIDGTDRTTANGHGAGGGSAPLSGTATSFGANGVDMDEVSVWGRALSAPEVSYLSTSGGYVASDAAAPAAPSADASGAYTGSSAWHTVAVASTASPAGASVSGSFGGWESSNCSGQHKYFYWQVIDAFYTVLASGTTEGTADNTSGLDRAFSGTFSQTTPAANEWYALQVSIASTCAFYTAPAGTAISVSGSPAALSIPGYTGHAGQGNLTVVNDISPVFSITGPVTVTFSAIGGGVTQVGAVCNDSTLGFTNSPTATTYTWGGAGLHTGCVIYAWASPDGYHAGFTGTGTYTRG
jgi:PKD repeat protein